MGFMCGGEFIQDSRDLEPADDAGICYDPECDPMPEHCDNCGVYIGAEVYERYGGLCYHCREPL